MSSDNNKVGLDGPVYTRSVRSPFRVGQATARHASLPSTFYGMDEHVCDCHFQNGTERKDNKTKSWEFREPRRKVISSGTSNMNR
jgi:hypothetical protein